MASRGFQCDGVRRVGGRMVAGRVEEGAIDEAGGQDVEEGGGEKQTLVVG